MHQHDPHHCVVTVTSTAPPPITWHCPSCRRDQPFDCSEKFRANSNGKLVDIWLIYRCRRCEATKNITVVERTAVRRVPAPLLTAAMDNDAASACRLARDVALLRRAGALVAGPDSWRIAEPPAPCVAGELTIEFPEPLLVRLDAVVAAALQVPRKRVGELVSVLSSGASRMDKLRLWSTVSLQRPDSPAFRHQLHA